MLGVTIMSMVLSFIMPKVIVLMKLLKAAKITLWQSVTGILIIICRQGRSLPKYRYEINCGIKKFYNAGLNRRANFSAAPVTKKKKSFIPFATRGGSFLWEIESNPPSYFFGTIHVPYTRVWDAIPHNAKKAFERSQFYETFF
jgi:hypothetical protein